MSVDMLSNTRIDDLFYDLWHEAKFEMGQNEAGLLGSSVCFFSSDTDNRLFATVWQLHLIKRRIAHAGNDWSQKVADVLDRPGWRCIQQALFWIRSLQDGRHFVGSRRSQVDQRLRDKAVDNVGWQWRCRQCANTVDLCHEVVRVLTSNQVWTAAQLRLQQHSQLWRQSFRVAVTRVDCTWPMVDVLLLEEYTLLTELYSPHMYRLSWASPSVGLLQHGNGHKTTFGVKFDLRFEI